LTLAGLLVLVALAGCGYTIGSLNEGNSGGGSSGLSRTIAVLLLDNATAEPLLGEIVSERLNAQLLASGPWRIVGAGQRPELLLNGHVTTLKTTPVAFDADSRATEYQMEIHLNVIVTSASDGSTIWSAPDLIGAADYYVDQNSVAASRESKERAFRDAGQRLAESVVQQLALLPVAPGEASSDRAGDKAAAPPATPPTTK
jgi:outer membrane lipopolysaccharide assembly protein LptE/RlpB